MKTRIFAIFVSIAGLCACSSPQTLGVRFDSREAAWFSARGTNSLNGTAIARAYTGNAKTCAALPVYLFPVTTYAKARMKALYGSESEGFNPALMGTPANFTDDDPAYFATSRTTNCDAKGRFSFSELPDGDYFLVGEVTWQDRRAGLPQGGYLMRRVSLSTGESKEVLLAH
ncbi:hypothetical protein FHS83_001081 [Rhizomicrobium palustre]|uniref:Carboxypeptidase regulatory-like domain-containing protein n=1 Tax=Rhizomicrobium palustre TaxID=189966 RepID=A0A846MWP4_9PROT|nr:hypothetical protein [Rhizomicrobium palustre]NIK87763.1 hypothetical protein [Rhizomicrobium palustre]